MQNNEGTIAKYAVDANLFRLGSSNPKKNIQCLDAFWGGFAPTKKKIDVKTSNVKNFWTIGYEF